jgi:hypothetical protein
MSQSVALFVLSEIKKSLNVFVPRSLGLHYCHTHHRATA